MFRRALRLFFGEQMPANARLQTPGAPGTLHHRGLTDALRRQPRQTVAYVVTRHAFQAAVHHQPNALDRQAGFSDVGRQHHLAAANRRRLNRFLLLRQRQRAIQRAKIGIACHLAGQSLQHPIDLRHARQEQQQRPRLFGQQALHRRRYAILQPLMAGQRLI